MSTYKNQLKQANKFFGSVALRVRKRGKSFQRWQKALFEEGPVRLEAPMIGQAFLLLFLLEKSNKIPLEEETSL